LADTGQCTNSFIHVFRARSAHSCIRRRRLAHCQRAEQS